MVLLLFGPTSQRTIRRTQQTTYAPTRTHLRTHTHPATIQGFCADVLRLPVKAISRVLVKYKNSASGSLKHLRA